MKAVIRWNYKMVLSSVMWYFFSFHLSVLSFKTRGFLAYFKGCISKVLLWVFIFSKYPLLKDYNTKSKTQGDWKEEAMDRL